MECVKVLDSLQWKIFLEHLYVLHLILFLELKILWVFFSSKVEMDL